MQIRNVMDSITNQDRKRIIALAGLVALIATLALFMQFSVFYEIGFVNNRQMLTIAAIVTMQVFALFAVLLVQTKYSLSVVNKLAYIDELTGLVNRRKFNKQLSTTLKKNMHKAEGTGILLLDLDRFKSINDTHGHDAGDKVICQFGERISTACRSAGMVSRLSGDEFAVMMDTLQNESDIINLCDRVIRAMKEPFVYEGRQIEASVSIGAAVIIGKEDPELSALRMADYALLEAKESGRNTFRLFNAKMEACIKRRRNIERGLRQAIANHRMNLKYQPFIIQNSSKVSGVEAFIRWSDPVEGEILPSEFIPIAEEMGLLCKLGEFIMEQACREILPFGSIRLAINISHVQFMQEGFVEQVKRTLEKTGFAPQRLELELGQTLLVSEALSIREKLQELRELGIRIVLDDFGTSYRSMFFLRDFKLDRIKLDRKFVASMSQEKDGIEIMESMIRLGSTFSDRLTVEGVETDAQRKVLSETKANDLQGFLFSKPLSVEDLSHSPLIQESLQPEIVRDVRKIAS